MSPIRQALLPSWFFFKELAQSEFWITELKDIKIVPILQEQYYLM